MITKPINAGSEVFGKGFDAGRAHTDLGQGFEEEDGTEGAGEVFSISSPSILQY